MHTFIENNNKEPIRRNRRQASLIHFDLDEDSEIKLIKTESKPPLISRSPSLISRTTSLLPIKLAKSSTISSFLETFESKTERKEERTVLPTISKHLIGRSSVDLRSSKKIIPKSLNTKPFKKSIKVSQGLTVISMNSFHIYQSLWGKD